MLDAAGATLVRPGQEVVLRDGLVWPAVLFSVGIPGRFACQSRGPYWLVDGGVLNPEAADLGAAVVIGVRVRDSPARTGALGRACVAAAADVLVEPRGEGAPSVGLRNFSRGRRYIQAGERAAEAALLRLPRLQHA
jgi:predicted acylesterase/phospholipase RssA